MNPTEQQLKNRKLAIGKAYSPGASKTIYDNGTVVDNPGNFPSSPTPITADTQTNTNNNINLPEVPTGVQDFTNTVNANIASLTKDQTKGETQQSDLQKQILDSLQTLGGEGAKKTQLEQQAGLPEQKQQLQDITNQLQAVQKEALAIPLQIQQEFTGRGATAGGVAPIEASRMRKNAIHALSLSAIGQTLQGNIGLAQQNIQSALDAEFGAEKLKLEYLQKAYNMNKDSLDRIDKKRSDALAIALQERERVLKKDEAEKQNIYNIGLLASQYGADSTTVQEIMKSKNANEAIANASGFLQDPAAKESLVGLKLGNTLKKIQIDSELQQQYYLNLFGGMTRKEYESYQKDKITEQKKAETELEQTKLSIKNEEATKSTLEGLLNHKGMTRAVGSYGIARWTPFQIDQDAVNEFTGVMDNLLSQLTLDKLIDAKNRGATFGALSDAELSILASAASPLAGWEKKRDDGSIYFAVSEETFKAQLKKLIKQYDDSIKLQKARTGVMTDDEVAVMDDLWNTDNQNQFDPTAYAPLTNSSTPFKI